MHAMVDSKLDLRILVLLLLTGVLFELEFIMKSIHLRPLRNNRLKLANLGIKLVTYFFLTDDIPSRLLDFALKWSRIDNRKFITGFPSLAFKLVTLFF